MPLVGSFGCLELCLYGLREVWLTGSPLSCSSSVLEDVPDWDRGRGVWAVLKYFPVEIFSIRIRIGFGCLELVLYGIRELA